MQEQLQGEFLRKRMIELREINGVSQADMARKLNTSKSALSRVESGVSGFKTILNYAELYCAEFHLTDQQKEQFLRGNKAVVTDTSALLKNDQLLDELSQEYSWVVVPTIVVNELDSIKNHNTNNLAPKAWRIIQSITNHSSAKGGNVITREYNGEDQSLNNDQRIIGVAYQASEEFKCSVDIITYDTGFAARLSGDTGPVKSLFLLDYLATKQKLTNMDAIIALDEYYADDYSNTSTVLGIRMPSAEELNAYLPNGNTLIISVVRNRNKPMNQRKAKIKWLMENGADVNKRDCGKYYFPPLSHSVQNDDFEIFKFLLHDCNANPNVGSRNPHDSGKIRQKNDGNMPLMIAAWDGKLSYIKELCADPRTSINQQDGNGFTALIKASYKRRYECREYLKQMGADTKIVDRDGYTEQDRFDEAFETGRGGGDYRPKKNWNKNGWNGNRGKYNGGNRR